MKNIIFIAPPAAGKGTVSAKVCEKYNIPHISTGDLLRDEIAHETKLGIEIKEAMAKGEFVTDEVITKLLKKRLSAKDAKKGKKENKVAHKSKFRSKYNDRIESIKQADEMIKLKEQKMRKEARKAKKAKEIKENKIKKENVNFQEDKEVLEFRKEYEKSMRQATITTKPQRVLPKSQRGRRRKTTGK